MSDPWTWHGGGLAAATRRFGEKNRWIDLSTGINPHAWPGAETISIDWRRLPEPEALQALEAAAAQFFGVEPRHVCAVPGSEAGMRLAARLIGGHARHLTPCYRTHAEMFETSAAIDWPAAQTCAGTLTLANPNNPDGAVRRVDDLDALLAGRRAGEWLLIDEAYADCLPAVSMAARIDEARRLLIFRSFGKFFGLAGLRLGFVLGPAWFLDQLRKALGAWPICSAAIAIGAAAYRDHAWTGAMRARLMEESAAFDALFAWRGFTPIGRCPLFRLIETTDAGALFDHLAHAAILTRPFAEQPHWLRIGLPADVDALAQLNDALERFTPGG